MIEAEPLVIACIPICNEEKTIAKGVCRQRSVWVRFWFVMTVPRRQGDG